MTTADELRAHWWAAQPLINLRNALNAHWPHRDRASDGFIGDARHALIKSDHNPSAHSDPPGCVRGGDFDVDGIDAPFVAEHLRLAGAAGDRRLAYVIYSRQYAGADTGWRWVRYTGDDPHTSHIHVSSAAAGDRDNGGWPFLEVAQAPVQPTVDHPGRVPAHDATGADAGFRAHLGDEGPKIEAMQHELNERFPAYSDLVEDGNYGPRTAAVLDEFSERAAHDGVTPVGDRQALIDSDGEDVGPRTARALDRYGVV